MVADEEVRQTVLLRLIILAAGEVVLEEPVPMLVSPQHVL
jgi:hypothetical protein